MKRALEADNLGGTGGFGRDCRQWMEQLAVNSTVFLTTSGSSILIFAALLTNIQPGDEIIVPSYTYVATVNAFL